MLLNHPSGTDETFVRIHRWQVMATGSVAASALLSLFEGFHLSRINAQSTQGEERGDITLLQHHTEKQLAFKLNGIATEKTIRAAIKTLADKGFISIRSNPTKPTDRTKYFLFHPDVAQAAIEEYLATKSTPGGQTVVLPDVGSVVLPHHEESCVKSNSSSHSVVLPDGEMPNGSFTAASGKTTVCTYISRSLIDIKEPNQKKSHPNTCETGQFNDCRKDPAPLPPAPSEAVLARVEEVRDLEDRTFSRDRHQTVQERYKSKPFKREQSVPTRPLNPWNVDNSPSKFDSEFVEYMRTYKFKLIDCSASDPIDVARVQQWLMIANNPDRDDRLALVQTSFSEFESERSRKRELDALATRYHPDNFRGFRELSRALESFGDEDMMQIYYCRHTHRNLYYGIRSIGKTYKHEIPFGKDAVKEVFECCKRLYGWADGMTVRQFAEKIGLSHWHSFFKVEEKVAA